MEAPAEGSLEPGCSVQVSGLQSASGKELNGRRGVITRLVPDSGRFEVRFSKSRFATVRPENLAPVPSLPSDSVLLEGVEGLDPDALSPCLHRELPFNVGDFVETFGLQSEVGRELNGKNGCILKHVEESDRFEVRFALGQIKGKWEYRIVHLKADQLKLVSKNPCAKKKLPPPRQEHPQPVFNHRSFGLRPGGFGAAAARPEEAEPEPPAYAPPPMDLSPGDEVEIFGLRSEAGRPLNGRTATVWGACTEDVSRWEVKLMPEEELKSLKRGNLRKLPSRTRDSYT